MSLATLALVSILLCEGGHGADGNGSYCYIDNRFTGQESSPPYDLLNFPGEGWDQIDEPPDILPLRVWCSPFIGVRSQS